MRADSILEIARAELITMMPVGQATVVDFLEWLRQKKPAIRSLVGLDRDAYLQLVDEYATAHGRQPPISHDREHWEYAHWVMQQLRDRQDTATHEYWYDALLIDWRDLLATGLKVRREANPAARHRDLLEAHLTVPNRMFIFYTSEDDVLGKYIKENWDALDGASGETCHLFQSLWQHKGEEDAHQTLSKLSNVPGVSDLHMEDFPAFVLWSDRAHLTASLRGLDDSQDRIRQLFRHIFGYLQRVRRPITGKDARRLEREIKAMVKPPQQHEQSALQFLGPLIWALPLVILFPLMTYTLSTGGVFGSIVVFFFVLLLYGLVCVAVLKAQGKLRDKDFMEAFKLVFSTSLVGLKELVAKPKE